MGGEMQLEFVSGNIMIKTETGSAYKDSFRYQLSTGSITLTPVWTNQFSPSPFDFQIIDGNTIKIQSLISQIPEKPRSYMIFKK